MEHPGRREQPELRAEAGGLGGEGVALCCSSEPAGWGPESGSWFWLQWALR